MKTYSPKEFGKLIARTTQTLQRWDRAGILKAHRSVTNRRYYTHDQYVQVIGRQPDERKRVVYCRVSSAGQRNDLAHQKQALEHYCLSNGKPLDLMLEDVGSGLNYRRKNFVRLMEMVERGEVGELIIGHKDRLVRFGYEWFEHFCEEHGTRIVVMNAESLSPEAEMRKDLLSIVDCFSSRLCGLRTYKKQIAEMVKGGGDADGQASER